MSTVLVVEHDVDFRDFLKRPLVGRYDVLEAACPMEALDICRVHRIDLLVCNTEPGLVSGMELASLLRAWNSNLHTVLITDLPRDQWTDRQNTELNELPSDDLLILEKPFQAMEFHMAVSVLIAEALVATK